MVSKEGEVMRILIVLGLLLAAHLNLTALVPAKAGQAPPPWWVGGRIVWPFGLDTQTLVHGDALSTMTPLLGIVSAVLFVLAAAAVLGWAVPTGWAAGLVVAGAACSLVLQVVWISPWAVLPLVVDGLLLWVALAPQVTAIGARA
jgi:hypothetical protein